MQNIDVNAMAQAMIKAAEAAITGDWQTVSTYASHEFQQLAEDSVMLSNLVNTGQVTAATATILMDMHANATRSVLAAIEGITLIAVEAALNAALGVLKTTVNTAIGFVLF